MPVTPPSTSGDRDLASEALERVVGRFAQMMQSIARRYGVPESDVGDVVQEVRVRLWRAHPASETIGQLGVSYVYRTAISAAIAVVGRHRSAEALSDTPAPVLDQPDGALARSEVAHAVALAVGRLPERRRVAVRMHLAGYSRDEISDACGWSEAKTRNLLYRGLADLRADLARRGISQEELA
jgi:RNA polymerase sigma-70 factor (ECF subfamily)